MQSPKFNYDPAKHLYTCGDEPWPSVTQLLQEFKLIDLSHIPVDRLNEKRILGTVVHKAAEYLDDRKLDEVHFAEKWPRAVPYLNAYKRFREIEDFEPVHNERQLWSRKWRFAGTMDRQGIFKGHDAIIDLKCSWEMYASNGPQTAGYDILFEETFKVKNRLRFGLQLKENESYELHEYKDKQDYSDFLACVVLHWRKRNHYKTSKGVANGTDN